MNQTFLNQTSAGNDREASSSLNNKTTAVDTTLYGTSFKDATLKVPNQLLASSIVENNEKTQ